MNTIKWVKALWLNFYFFLARIQTKSTKYDSRIETNKFVFLFPNFGFTILKSSVTKITTIERKQLFSIIEYFQNKLP